MKKTWIAISAALLVAGAIAAYDYSTASRDSAAKSPAASPSLPATPPPAKSPFNDGHPLKDTSMLKLPAGAKVAIFEWEDLECPACGYAYPIVHATAAQYKVPVVRHDYPWFFHNWALDGAITARYLQDKVSPQLADDFRRDVFANQAHIESKDDLLAYTRTWFKAHGQTLPFVIDATGSCRTEVEADHTLGDRLGIASTPCIIVVTRTGFVPVAYSDIDQLGQIVRDAVAQADASSAASLDAPTHSGRRPATARS